MVAPPHFARNAPERPLSPLRRQRPGILGSLPAVGAGAASECRHLSDRVAPPARRVRVRAAPGSFRSAPFRRKPKHRSGLREAQSVAKGLLAKADPFTERVTKGSQELLSARFAGFDQDSAEAACKYFKRDDIVCMAIKN